MDYGGINICFVNVLGVIIPNQWKVVAGIVLEWDVLYLLLTLNEC
jgi:hypothetical protein